MKFGTSFRVGRGTYVHAGGAGAVGIVLLFAYIGFLLRLSLLIISTFAVVATPIAIYLANRARDKRRNDRLRTLVLDSIEPTSVLMDGSYTNPRTWGVYRIKRLIGGVRGPYLQFGNHPIRQQELVREYGEAQLMWLFKARIDAEEVVSLLNEYRPSGKGKRRRL